MKFEEVLVEFRKGKTIICPAGFTICLGKFIGITLCEIDILSEEWKLKEETGKTFPEVFEAFKDGRKIKRKSWTYQYSFLQKESFGALSCEDLLATDWIVMEE